MGVPGRCKLQTPSSPYPDRRRHPQGPGPLSEKPNKLSENPTAKRGIIPLSGEGNLPFPQEWMKAETPAGQV